MFAANRGFLCDRWRLGFRDRTAHPLGRFHHRPNLILGLAVVPDPSNQPSAKVLGIGCAYIASVENDFLAALGKQIKITIALTTPRCYMFHCKLRSKLPRPLWRGFFRF